MDKTETVQAECGWQQAWIGPCREPKPCAKHQGRLCTSCAAAATHDCDETGQFVCGEHLCDDCEHSTFPDGANGGVGFNAQDLPEGMKRHCRKTEQKHTPWYARDEFV